MKATHWKAAGDQTTACGLAGTHLTTAKREKVDCRQCLRALRARERR